MDEPGYKRFMPQDGPIRGETPFGWFSLLRGKLQPATIIPSKHEGHFEGAKFLAFPCEPKDVPPEAYGTAAEVLGFFEKAEEKRYPIGRGTNPRNALDQLVKILAATEGVYNPDDRWKERKPRGDRGKSGPRRRSDPGRDIP